MCKKLIYLASFVLILSMVSEGWASSDPDPADGAENRATWVILKWTPGANAVSFDVYFGDNFIEVENGTGNTFQGNQTLTYLPVGLPGFPYPNGLVPGTRYYWRVHDLGNNWTGDVWSFSVPPKTAYNPDPADGAEFVNPNVTFSWSPGLGAKLHTFYIGDSFNEVDNATGGTPQGAATYTPPEPLEPEKLYFWRVDEFDILDTHKGDIWSFTTPGAVGNPQPADGAVDVQMNAILSWTAADGAASHEIYLGTDPVAIKNATKTSPEYKGSKALGAESYNPGLLDSDTSYYWRVDEVYNENPIKGPIWSFTVGAHLMVDDFESYTDDDTAGEAIWQTWIDGFGISDNGAKVGYLVPPYAEQTIIHGGTQSMPLLYANVGRATYSEATLPLDWLRDWTEGGVSSLSLWFKGDSFNSIIPMYVTVVSSPIPSKIKPMLSETALFIMDEVDSGNIASELEGSLLAKVNAAISALDKGNPNYAKVAMNDLKALINQVEAQTNKKIMPGVATEITQQANVIVARLNGTVRIYHADPAVTQITGWTEWIIDLQAFADQGVNLTNVDTVSIGIGTKNDPAADGTGTMYFDDIKLVR